MGVWTFYDFIEASGRNPLAEWMSGLSAEAQAWIDARILQMEAMTRWPEKWISKYHGTEQIYELRIPFDRLQYRPLGTYMPGRAFVLLSGAIEKRKIPRATIETAIRRQKILEAGPTHVRRHQFYPDPALGEDAGEEEVP